MIIFFEGDRKYYITNSTFPNTDWTVSEEKPNGDATYVVDDNSELVKKIKEYWPKVIFETDETGKNVIGVTRDPTVTEAEIQDAINSAKQWVSNACELAIIAGVDVNGEHYSLTIEDQANIIAWMAVAQTGKSVPYHSDGNPCRMYTAEEFMTISTAVVEFKTYQTTYCNLLMRQIEEMTDVAEISSVVFGTTQLNDKYMAIMQSIINPESNG